MLSLDESDDRARRRHVVHSGPGAARRTAISLRCCAPRRRRRQRGIACILDPILDPIHFGFSDSLARYVELRRRLPDAEMMMGTGNLTELTEADTSGITAVLLGICSELAIRNVLTVQVSPHTRRTLEEHDAARRLMFAAREDQALPKEYGAGAAATARPHAVCRDAGGDRRAGRRRCAMRTSGSKPRKTAFTSTTRDGHQIAQDAFSLFPICSVEQDGAHAFYLGAELTKAEIALRLGKRYVQDEPLDWGVAAPTSATSGGSCTRHCAKRRAHAAKQPAEEND